MNMNSFRKFALVAGLLLVGLFIGSAATPIFNAQNLSMNHLGSTQMPGVTVSPYPNNAVSIHNTYSTSGYLTGLPDNNPSNDYPGVNYPGTISVSF